MKGIKLLMPVLINVFVVVIILISIGPLVWVFVSSFKSNMEILSSPLALPSHLKISNYFNSFKYAPITQFYLNSIIVAIGGTILNLVLLGMTAYALARHNFKGKKLLVSFLSLSLLIPGAALLQPLYSTMHTVGLYDKLLGLVVVYAGFGLPTSLYVLYSYFLTIPRELEESAYLDGAGFLRTFISIVIPIAKPGFSTAGILQFLLCWNEFQFALILTTGNASRTIPIALYYFRSQIAFDYGAMFAATMIVVIPSIVVYAILQEQVVSGLAAGAIKG